MKKVEMAELRAVEAGKSGIPVSLWLPIFGFGVAQVTFNTDGSGKKVEWKFWEKGTDENGEPSFEWAFDSLNFDLWLRPLFQRINGKFGD